MSYCLYSNSCPDFVMSGTPGWDLSGIGMPACDSAAALLWKRERYNSRSHCVRRYIENLLFESLRAGRAAIPLPILAENRCCTVNSSYTRCDASSRESGYGLRSYATNRLAFRGAYRNPTAQGWSWGGGAGAKAIRSQSNRDEVGASNPRRVFVMGGIGGEHEGSP